MEKKAVRFKRLLELTGWSASTAYKKTASGEIKCYKPSGKLLYFLEEDINNYLLRNPKDTQETLAEKAGKDLLRRRSHGKK